MSAFCGAVFLVGAVLVLSQVFGLFATAVAAVRTSRSALAVLHDSACGDDRKEALLQAYSVALLTAFLALVLRSAGAIAIPLGVLVALEAAGVVSLQGIFALTLSWPFLLGSVTAACVACWCLEK